MPISNNTNSSLVYCNVSCGKFHIGRGDSISEYDCISGKFDSVRTWYDEGNKAKQILPQHKGSVTVFDGETRYIIAFRLDSTFGWMMATFIRKIKKGDDIQVSIWAGSDNPKVSICKVEVKNDAGDWVVADRMKSPETQAQKHKLAHAVFEAHPDLYIPKVEEPQEEKVEEDEYDPFADE